MVTLDELKALGMDAWLPADPNDPHYTVQLEQLEEMAQMILVDAPDDARE